MDMSLRNLFIGNLLVLIQCFLIAESGLSLFNVTRMPRELSRRKRSLIFEGGGVCKMVYGAIYPVVLPDKIKWRQLNCGYNIQAQYAVPTEPLYWWEKFDGRMLKSSREKFDNHGSYTADESRKFIYILLETYMNNQGKNGRQCLLRTICENGDVDEVHGMFAEVVTAILTPGKYDSEDIYRDAFLAGQNGANCLKLYPKCTKGDSLFDSFVVTLTDSNKIEQNPS